MSKPEIYTGILVNWDRSPVLGATITLTLGSANMLISFLSILISSVISASAWHIVSYMLHWRLATSARQDRKVSDVSFLQGPLVLCNAESAKSAAWKMVTIRLAWRRAKARRKTKRTATGLVLTLVLLAVCFPVASILVPNFITTEASDRIVVLAKSGVYGQPIFRDVESMEGRLAMAKFERDSTWQARRHALAWYRDNDDAVPSTSMSSSSEVKAQGLAPEPIFPKTRIPLKKRTDTPCPFDDNMCRLGPNSSLELDTGILDSNVDFGINAPIHVRYQFRLLATCTPLNITDYVRSIPGPEEEPWQFVQALLGSWGTNTDNVTFQHQHLLRNHILYEADSISSVAGFSGTIGWHPIRELNRTDGDVTVVFISSNAVKYINKVYDPIFLADGTNNSTALLNGTETWFYATRGYTAVGCVEQTQEYNPVSGQCTTLSGKLGGNLDLDPQFNLDQLGARARFLVSSISSIGGSINNLAANALLATELAPSGICLGLPDNQWQLEVQHWFETHLARMQHDVIQSVALPDMGPHVRIRRLLDIDGIEDDDVDPALRAARSDACENQKIRTAAQVPNFSLLGVVLIVVVAALLLIVECFLEPFFEKVDKEKAADYQAHEVLNLGIGKMDLPRLVRWKQSWFGIPYFDSGREDTDNLVDYQVGGGDPDSETYVGVNGVELESLHSRRTPDYEAENGGVGGLTSRRPS